MGPGVRRDDGKISHRRQHLVRTIIGIKLSAALLADRGAARGGGSVFRDAERAAEAVGAAAWLAGEGGAGGADADHQQGGGGDFNGQSLGVLPEGRDLASVVPIL